MKVVYGLPNFKRPHKKPVVGLGVFDGLHLGHQKLIKRLIRQSRTLGTKSVLVTFSPHPQAEDGIYSLSHRLKLLEGLGVETCLVIRFSSSFRKISAQDFLQKILKPKINPAVVFVGKNFTFGKNAEGNYQMLKDYSQAEGFKLKAIDVLTSHSSSISSSAIRGLIKQGKLKRAKELLGRPVIILGRVIRGYHIGRMLGYPTANVLPDHEILPPFGVYAAHVKLGKKFFDGICYIGTRPTIKKSNKISVEVHIFNLRNNIYGRSIQIEFVKKIRGQKHFNSTQELSQRISQDILIYHNKFRLYSKTPQ